MCWSNQVLQERESEVDMNVTNTIFSTFTMYILLRVFSCMGTYVVHQASSGKTLFRGVDPDLFRRDRALGETGPLLWSRHGSFGLISPMTTWENGHGVYCMLYIVMAVEQYSYSQRMLYS